MVVALLTAAGIGSRMGQDISALMPYVFEPFMNIGW